MLAGAAALAGASMAGRAAAARLRRQGGGVRGADLPASTATAPACRRCRRSCCAALVAGSALTVAYTLASSGARSRTKPGRARRPRPATRPPFGLRRSRRSLLGRGLAWSAGFVGPPLTAGARAATPTTAAVGEPATARAVARPRPRRWASRRWPLAGGVLLFWPRALIARVAGRPSRGAVEAEERLPVADARARPARGRGHRASPSAARCRSTSAPSCSCWSCCPAAALLTLRALAELACRLWDTPGAAAGRRR